MSEWFVIDRVVMALRGAFTPLVITIGIITHIRQPRYEMGGRLVLGCYVGRLHLLMKAADIVR